jgi:hypothetical protein
MTTNRQCALGVLLVTGAGFAALPVAAGGQGPAIGLPGGAPRTPDVVGQVQQKLDGLRPRQTAPKAGRAPGGAGSPKAAAPRPAAPARSTGRVAPSAARRAPAGAPVSHSASGAARAAASGSNGPSTPAAKAAGSGSGRSSHSAAAGSRATRPTVVAPGSQVQNRPDLPFTGFDVLRVAGIGAVALLAGLALRLALRRRFLA